MLHGVLDGEYVRHLPPLLDTRRPPNEQQNKNRSRAFSAFALHNICGISSQDAAQAVVDDFDDYGVDTIYYHGMTETLYLIQSKLKAAEEFSQQEALAFCQGVRKLLRQDFDGFNKNIQDRVVEVEDGLDNCSHIQLVIAHTGAGISKHAKDAIEGLLTDESHGEERLRQEVIDYNSKCVVAHLQGSKAYRRVDTELWVQKCTKVDDPRITYFGLVKLLDLVGLHEKHGDALYEKNIRTFLGQKTEVNTSIQQTLANKPEEFLYLNNGVTALCQEIHPKGEKKSKGGRRRLVVRGLSVINGAQTIASSAALHGDDPTKDISAAKISVTLIKADSDGDFGKSVTRARNHQNPVLLANFAALDDEQERLRRDLALIGIHYAYKAEGAETVADSKRIRIDEAAQALAMLQPDPRYVVWLKKEPARLLDTASDQYKTLFGSSVTAFQLANAVCFNRYAQSHIAEEVMYTSGQERLAYKHGNYALAWILAKQATTAINSAAMLDESRLGNLLSMDIAFDGLRQTLWDATRMAIVTKGPLALFRNQTDTIPLLEKVLIQHYGLTTDPVVEHKRRQQKSGQPYPEELFAYLVSKAPQIGNLA
jgi:hypothetical protein